ncbi:MAG: glycosyltransferase family 2 protein [Gemmatimonadetes bacterium]|nr:glycosyltransferase family 2 protein [Gemmatimonadota bacterium]
MADGARRDGAEVTVVIPAYRAASTLGDVLERARRAAPGAAVLVVDDGSDDATAAVGRAGGAAVIRHPANFGKGRALATGLAAAKSRGARQVVTMDADGQHPPEAIPRLLAPVLAGSADLVVGARRRDPGAMPLGRRVTNWLSSALVSRALGAAVPDSQSGFRAMSGAVARSIRPKGLRYEYETEFLFLAAAQGFRVAAVEIPTVYLGAGSHFRAGADTVRLAGVFLRHWRSILSGPHPT